MTRAKKASVAILFLVGIGLVASPLISRCIVVKVYFADRHAVHERMCKSS